MTAKIFITIILFALLSACDYRWKCKYFKIKKIGVCSYNGLCGVILENGVQTEALRPVIGGEKPVCGWEKE